MTALLYASHSMLNARKGAGGGGGGWRERGVGRGQLYHFEKFSTVCRDSHGQTGVKKIILSYFASHPCTI